MLIVMSKTLAFLFMEPSTRTYASFALAAKQLGWGVVTLTPGTSSLAKGESLEDTIDTLCLLGYDGIVLRTPDDDGFERASAVSSIPVIDAGSGIRSHPSQAAIDDFTLRQRGINPKDCTVAFVGDVVRSRVFQSVKDIFGKYVVADAEDAAFSRAEVIYCLRPQYERGFKGRYNSFKIEQRHLDFADAYLMHPGPYIGVEFDRALLRDRRCLVRDQVANSTHVRKIILRGV